MGGEDRNVKKAEKDTEIQEHRHRKPELGRVKSEVFQNCVPWDIIPEDNKCWKKNSCCNISGNARYNISHLNIQSAY